MASISIINRTSVILLDGVIDGYISDEHSIQVDHTLYPVENRGGAALIDHAVVRPETLTLEAFCSNVVPSQGVNEFAHRLVRPQQAWARIRAMMRTREPVVVETPLRTYEDMLVVSASATQDENTGRGLLVRLGFIEIQFVDVTDAAGSSVNAAPGSIYEDRILRAQRGRVVTTTVTDAVVA